REGDVVAAGALLAEIDPRPFQVQLTQAEGQMAKDQAQLKNAQIDLERYNVLYQQDSIAKQQLDTQEALVRQDEGAIKVDQGQIDNARLQLDYCRITAPISGRVGLRLVDPGNIVHASDTNGLIVITQIDPIAVIFAIAEDSLPQVQQQMRGGRQLPVEAYDRDLKHKLATGSLMTIDNQIDPTTGTVKFKAVFPNKEGVLFLISSLTRGCSSIRSPTSSSFRTRRYSTAHSRPSSMWSNRTTQWRCGISRSKAARATKPRSPAVYQSERWS